MWPMGLLLVDLIMLTYLVIISILTYDLSFISVSGCQELSINEGEHIYSN